jgi:hypothetical protein
MDGGVETRFLRRHQIVVLGAIGRRGMGPNKGRLRKARHKMSLAVAAPCVSRVLLVRVRLGPPDSRTHKFLLLMCWGVSRSEAKEALSILDGCCWR